MELPTEYYENDFRFLEKNPDYIEYVPHLVDYILQAEELPQNYDNNISFLFNRNRKGRTVRFCEYEAELKSNEEFEKRMESAEDIVFGELLNKQDKAVDNDTIEDVLSDLEQSDEDEIDEEEIDRILPDFM